MPTETTIKRDKPYAVRVLEAQWDPSLEQSVRPYLAELQQGRVTYRSRDKNRTATQINSNALFEYSVFSDKESLTKLAGRQWRGAEGHRRLLYIASHGTVDGLATMLNPNLSRKCIANAMAKISCDGILFGSCLFCNSNNANFLLPRIPKVKWIAGYDRTIDWLASTVCDLLFMRILLDGWFSMKAKKCFTRTVQDKRDAFELLYKAYPTARELGFNLYYREKGPGSAIKNCRDSISQ